MSCDTVRDTVQRGRQRPVARASEEGARGQWQHRRAFGPCHGDRSVSRASSILAALAFIRVTMSRCSMRSLRRSSMFSRISELPAGSNRGGWRLSVDRCWDQPRAAAGGSHAAAVVRSLRWDPCGSQAAEPPVGCVWQPSSGASGGILLRRLPELISLCFVTSASQRFLMISLPDRPSVRPSGKGRQDKSSQVESSRVESSRVESRNRAA